MGFLCARTGFLRRRFDDRLRGKGRGSQCTNLTRGPLALLESRAHDTGLPMPPVRLAADFAPPVATSLDPIGVKKAPPFLSRTHSRVGGALPDASVGGQSSPYGLAVTFAIASLFHFMSDPKDALEKLLQAMLSTAKTPELHDVELLGWIVTMGRSWFARRSVHVDAYYVT